MVSRFPTRRAVLSLAAAVPVVAIAACTPQHDTAALPAGAATSAPAASGPAPTSPRPAQEFYEGLPDAVWDEAARAEATRAAQAAMRAFADTKAGTGPWWDGYGPLLEAGYAQDAFHIDPARIAVTGWSGPRIVNGSANPLTATAVFDTDDGPWTMLLHRRGPGKPWLVSRLSRAGGTP